MGIPRFHKQIIGELRNEVGGGQMNTLLTLGDIDGDGLTDVVVSGRNGQMAWFRNPGTIGPWERHTIADIAHLECGGLTWDLTGNGLPDVINGSDSSADEVAWWENRGGEGPWSRHLIAKTYDNQFHDELIGDVTGDGRLSLVFSNQKGPALYRVPVPADPRVSPWPGLEVIAEGLRDGGLPDEGLAIADLDGDGQNEIVCGCRWYKHVGGRWVQYRYTQGYITTVIAVGDIDGDGRPEIVLSEGDPCIYGHPEGGKLAWFKPAGDIRGLWTEHRLAEGLLDAHSLQLGDVCGNGRLDIVCGEIGLRDRYRAFPPKLIVYENLGDGRFERHIIDEGTGSHHAKLADLRGTGRLDIVSRPLHGPEKWSVVVWYNEG